MSHTLPPISEMDRAYFNRYSGGYSPYTADDLRLLLDDLLEAMRGLPSPRICEVGSADGQFSRELARRLPETPFLLGFDIAEGVLRLYPFHKLVASAFQIPAANESLDVVCYAAALHHLAPFALSLREMNRVLAPGGLAYFLEPNFFHPQRRFLMSRPALYRRYRPANDTPVNPETLRRALSEQGIEVLHLRYITLHFKSPGVLQGMQNAIARLPWPARLARYVHPWFVMIARKNPAHA
ncbi:MAG: class I SAM-dependent methyltransferase [Caldilineae bacterium]|nr:MAG: class I SAM-dependent methyltransferase [Caldilineae bacterium]